MQDLRVQPYKDFDEFLKVANLIVNDSKFDKIKALTILKIWCERRPENKIARSIILTKYLLDAFLNKKSIMSKSVIISKFINSECKEEEDRNSYNHKIPLFSTAVNIKLPAYMIGLRHDLVHGDEEVAEPRLDEALTDSIDWLIDNFWKPQIQQINAFYVSKNEIIEILYEYLNLKKEGNLTWEHSYFKKLNKINSLSLKNFVDVLLSEDFMLNFNESNKNLLIIWKPMLQYLCGRRQIHSIIQNIFSKLSSINSSSILQNYLREWILFLLKSCSLKRHLNDIDSPRLRIMTHNINMINWPLILLTFLKNSLCKENIYVLQLLLETHLPELSEEKKVFVKNIVTEYFSNKNNLSKNVIETLSISQPNQCLEEPGFCFSFGI